MAVNVVVICMVSEVVAVTIVVTVTNIALEGVKAGPKVVGVRYVSEEVDGLVLPVISGLQQTTMGPEVLVFQSAEATAAEDATEAIELASLVSSIDLTPVTRTPRLKSRESNARMKAMKAIQNVHHSFEFRLSQNQNRSFVGLGSLKCCWSVNSRDFQNT